MPLLIDREHAGEELAHEFERLRLHQPIIVLGLARGGVSVAAPIARALNAALDVLVVRKIAMPGAPEFAIGAIAPGVIYESKIPVVGGRPISPEVMRALIARERAELERRQRLYRSGRSALDLHRKTVVLVDDGLATGATMLAAIRAARVAGAKTVIVAAPVASREALDLIDGETDAILVLQQPEVFFAVGQFYEHFEQVDDAAVCRELADQAAIDSTAVSESKRSTS